MEMECIGDFTISLVIELRANVMFVTQKLSKAGLSREFLKRNTSRNAQ